MKMRIIFRCGADRILMSELARATGLGRESFYKAPSGEREPEVGTIVKLLQALGLALDTNRRYLQCLSRYESDLTLNGQPAPILDGTTGDQRFFLSWAQTYRENIREPALRANLASDPHSPAVFRVNGVVCNMEAWYEAFDVEPGDRLYLAPGERISIW